MTTIRDDYNQRDRVKQISPFNGIFLYINAVTDKDEMIEIGYLFFKQNEDENNGKYEKIEEPQVFQCQPIKMKEGLETSTKRNLMP